MFSTTTGYQLRSFGDAASDLGVELMFATDRCHTLDDPWRDAAVAVRFHDEEASVGGDAWRRPPSGRSTAWSRSATGRSCWRRVRPRRWGCRGNRRTRRARARTSGWRASGSRAPACRRRVTSAGDGRADPIARVRRAQLSRVVKPVALSGSRGVIRADTTGGARRRVPARLARCWRGPRSARCAPAAEHEILVEDFIPGREYAIEGVMTRGAFSESRDLRQAGSARRPVLRRDDLRHAVARSPAAEQRAIVDSGGAAAAALGLAHGPVHAECRVRRPVRRRVRAGSRGASDRRAVLRVLRFRVGAAVDAVSLEEVLLGHALGERTHAGARRPTPRR